MSAIQQLVNLASEALAYSAATQTEIIISRSQSALTRFYHSQIHQNVAEVNGWVSVRAVLDKKVGVASTNLLTAEAVKNTVDQAVKAAKLAAPDAGFPGLPAAPKVSFSQYSEKTAVLTPKERAALVSQIFKVVNKYPTFTASGSLSNEESTLVVANSLGNLAQAQVTETNLNLVVSDGQASGYSHWLGYDIDALNIEAVAEKAAKKAFLSKNPVELANTKLAVVLEPPAVADLFSFLAYIGFSAQALQEKRSFLVGRLNQQLVSPLINFFDDANDKRSLGINFDFEGVPKQKVVFFAQGVAKDVVYDSYTASKEKKHSTGHALPAPNPHGPLPTNLIVEPGQTAYEDLISSVEQGLLITRFHYTNIEDARQTVYTGMTRDGTFLIEKGQVKKAVKNFRFTINIIDVLNKVEAVGSDGCLNSSMLQSCYAPSIRTFLY